MSCKTSAPSLNPNSNTLDQSNYLTNKKTILSQFEYYNTNARIQNKNCCNRFTKSFIPNIVNVTNKSNLTFNQSDYINSKRFHVEMAAKKSSLNATEKSQTLKCCSN
jgi:hypothetical protein